MAAARAVASESVFRALLPPHPGPLPSLSLGERDNRPPRLRHSRAPGLVAARDAVFPLPAGEGQGEGERAAANSPRFAPRALYVAKYIRRATAENSTGFTTMATSAPPSRASFASPTSANPVQRRPWAATRVNEPGEMGSMAGPLHTPIDEGGQQGGARKRNDP
jgi:hypothetical protein